MGSVGLPVFVSETRNTYLYNLSLMPMEDGAGFDLVQERGAVRRVYEGCWVKGFELRFDRGSAVKLRLDVSGERPPVGYPYTDQFKNEGGERFSGDFVSYRINGQDYFNIYGLTLSVKKEGGTKTEVRIKRSLEGGGDIPALIEEMTITAQLLRNGYEYGRYGMFRISITRLALVADETSVDSAGAVIGPLRYYVAGTVQAEVYSENGIHAVF
jgi:hypothetical protein